jgi:alpha-beta hydrolase superfamily lysophospholipase
LAEAVSAYTLETFQAGDGYRWKYRRYVPASRPLAHVVCIHGIQSHGGWYTHSCTRLGQAGFLVDFLDRRGSGLNEEQRGDAPGFRRLIDDLAEFLQERRSDRETQSGLGPVFLVAISWGGKLGVALQRRHPGLVDGLALLCPGFFPRVRPSFSERLGIVGSRLVSPERKFAIPLNDPELFTATPRWQQFVRDDPLALHEATARLLIESARLDGYLRWTTRPLQIPVLLMLAENDRIIANEPTRRFIEKFAAGDKQIIEYRGAHHTLEFEPEPDKFIDDLINWLQVHSLSKERHKS